jgi:hypothetical protein
MANKSLTQVADTLSTIGYVISMEGEDIGSQDLYAYANDLEDALAALLMRAKIKEQENV